MRLRLIEQLIREARVAEEVHMERVVLNSEKQIRKYIYMELCI